MTCQAEVTPRAAAYIPRGNLRISLLDAFGRLLVLPLLAEYQRLWPQVQVDASFTGRVVNIVDKGFDLAVRIGNLRQWSTGCPATKAKITIAITVVYDQVAPTAPNALATTTTTREAWEVIAVVVPWIFPLTMAAF